MPPYLFSNTPAYKTAKDIINKLKNNSFQAFLVGGCVRDMILKQETQDFDIVTSAHPEQVQKLFKKTFAVGAKFGVVIVLKNNMQFEVATFRADDRYIDGRRPLSVRFVDAKEDVNRRDFTINGLLYDVDENKIIDYIGGINDIKNKQIRTIGNPQQRFEEDKLRILRAVRFSSRLNFEIEKNTLDALKGHAKTINQVSKERIRDEFTKIILQKNPHNGFKNLFSTGLIEQILPEVYKLKGIKQPKEFHPEGDVYEHTKLMLKHMDETSFINKNIILAYSVILHDIGKPDTIYYAKDRIRFNNHDLVGKKITYAILRRLKFSKNQINDICECVGNHMNFINTPKMRKNRLKKFIRRPTFKTELDLHYLDCISSHKDLSTYNFLLERIKEFSDEKISPPPIITGKDLIQMGFRPGPLFKKILNKTEDMQLEDKLSTKKEAKEFVMSKFSKYLKKDI